MSDSDGNARRCQAITAGGQRCQKIVGGSQSFCFSHDPDAAKRRSENARKAARAKHTGPCDEILEARRQLKEIADNVLNRKLTPALGSVASQILGTYLKTFQEERKQREYEDLEKRVAEIEKRYNQRRDRRDDSPFDVGGMRR
jgi:hypothetical protein